MGQLDQVVFRDRLSLAGIAVLAWFATFGGSWVAYDAYAYWSVDPRAPYHFDFNPDQYGAFRYSPAVAQLFSLFHLLPWPAFAIGWFVFLALVVAWLGRRWSLALLVFVVPPGFVMGRFVEFGTSRPAIATKFAYAAVLAPIAAALVAVGTFSPFLYYQF